MTKGLSRLKTKETWKLNTVSGSESFCSKGHYWRQMAKPNEVWRLDGNNISVLIS